jgi:hypothetical protein
MRRGLLKVVEKFTGDGAAELAAQIEDAKRRGSEAYSEIERLEGERRGAETFEAASAIDDLIARLRFEIERLDRWVPELEERLADAKWEEREAAFAKHKKALIAATRKAIPAIEAAAQANAAIVAAHHSAAKELGDHHVAGLPLQLYLGLLYPDLVGAWKRQTEQHLAAMENAALTRPAKPLRPGTPQAPYRNPNRPPVQAAPPKPAAAAPPPPADPPLPKREVRHDGPPAEGQRQVHVIAGGDFNLPDGSRAKIGDRVNLTSKLADVWVGKGVAEFVDDAPEPVVVGDLRAAIDLKPTIRAEGAVQ